MTNIPPILTTTPWAHFPPNWESRLLSVLGADPNYTSGRRLFDVWARAEGGTAAFNPLNTTYRLPGSTDYNHVGVQNYKRATEGVCATALTLVNGRYNGILGALQGGKLTAREIVVKHRAEFHTWGTNPDVILGLL